MLEAYSRRCGIEAYLLYVSVSVSREFIQCIGTKAVNVLYALVGREKESF